jgi:hypothetical protein
MHQNLWLFTDIDPATGPKRKTSSRKCNHEPPVAQNKDGQKELLTAIDGTISKKNGLVLPRAERMVPQAGKLTSGNA